MIVTREALEDSLAVLAVEVADPAAGLHGPGSPAWRHERDVTIFAGGGRAALLQLAHPFVAYGVHQHSRTRDDAIGRFQRTFEHVFAMAFGTLDDAIASARRVHAIHTRVTGAIAEDAGAFPSGTPYHANDHAALTWVWATLVDSVVAVKDALGEPLDRAEREAYYRGGRRFARLFGLTPALLPDGWDAFARYVADTVASPILTVTAPARELAGFLFGGRVGGVARALTAHLLPPPLREAYALPYGPAVRTGARVTLAALRGARAITPRGWWDVPAYRDAQHRVRGLPPSRYARWMQRGLVALAGRTATPRAVTPR